MKTNFAAGTGAGAVFGGDGGHLEPGELAREKQIKRWNRQWKLRLIEKENPQWQDLATDWYDN